MALEQHPVPQQISSYQFRLVGDMTLKQFFQLAAGAGIGLLIYGSPLPGIIRWPLIIFFVIMGAAFAFLPVQDRPLSVWLLAFFRSVYSPTIFTWKREEQPVYFVPEEVETPSLSEAGESAPTQGDIQARFGEVASSFLENLEGAEENYLSKIAGLFKHGSNSSSTGDTQPEQAKVVNEVNPVIPPIPHFPNQQVTSSPNTATSVTPVPPSPQAPSSEAQTTYYRPTPTPPPSVPQGNTFQSASSFTGAPQPTQTPLPHTTPSFVNATMQSAVPSFNPPANAQSYGAPQPSTFQPALVPDSDKPLFQPSSVDMNVASPPQNIFNQISNDQPPVPVFQAITPQQDAVVEDKFFGLETPSQANILVGKVIDGDQNPLANAIMEIKDEFGRPVRALKTDKDGKFRIVTPLHDGKYTIYTEKDAFEFEPIQLELQDTIIEPMIVEARKL